jgi:hypothetical protein
MRATAARAVYSVPLFITVSYIEGCRHEDAIWARRAESARQKKVNIVYRRVSVSA